MPQGDGFWYDRIKHRYIRIDDHAAAVVADQARYRLVLPSTFDPVKDREQIILRAAQKQFIRVRHYKGALAWQFWGDPPSALKRLHGFFNRAEVGPTTVVTFTDFALGAEVNTVQGLAKDFVGPGRLRIGSIVRPLIEGWSNRNVVP